jgi:hypothetical protein
MGLTSVSGLGGMLTYFIPGYAAQGKTYDDISALMTCEHFSQLWERMES